MAGIGPKSWSYTTAVVLLSDLMYNLDLHETHSSTDDTNTIPILLRHLGIFTSCLIKEVSESNTFLFSTNKFSIKILASSGDNFNSDDFPCKPKLFTICSDVNYVIFF